MRDTQKARAYFFIIAQDILYGFGNPISKTAYDKLSVFSLLTARYWIGFFFLLLLGGRKVIQELRENDLRPLILPGCCIAGTHLLNNIALSLTTATAVSFLGSLSTVLTPLLAFLAFRKKFKARNIPALILGVIGLYLLSGPGSLSGFGPGEAVALGAALMMAGSLVFAGEALSRFSAMTVTTFQSAASAILATVLAFALEGGVHLQAAEPGHWLIILYLAILCTVAGYLLQNNALRHISASAVALLQCGTPVLTALFSFLLLGEQLSLSASIGAGLILAAVIINRE